MWLWLVLAVIATANLASGVEEDATGRAWPRQERRFDDESEQTNAIADEVDVILADEEGGGERGLVPQLWPNYTAPTEPPAHEVKCPAARLACAYRAGCGLALQSYAVACHALNKEAGSKCSSHCRHALIALLSTVEGARLMEVKLNSPVPLPRDSGSTVKPIFPQFAASQKGRDQLRGGAGWLGAKATGRKGPRATKTFF